MKIIAWPFISNKENNPYNWLLYSKIKEIEPLEIKEFKIYTIIMDKYDLVHIHWPENFLNKKGFLKNIFKLIAFKLILEIIKLKGGKIVWTAHNLKCHENNNIYLEKLFWKTFIKDLDGYITLTESSRLSLSKIHPEINKKNQFTIPHGHYKEAYENNISKKQSRKILNIDKDSFVILNFGKIREYKGITRLKAEFNKLSNKKSLLYIVGESKNHKILSQISNLENEKIILINKFIPSKDIQIYLNSADLIILPYKEILNSGSLFLALSFNKPVLVPDTPTFREIKDKVGSKWIKIYSGEINNQIIEESIKWARNVRNKKINLSDFNWDKIAHKTLNAYKEVIKNEK